MPGGCLLGHRTHRASAGTNFGQPRQSIYRPDADQTPGGPSPMSGCFTAGHRPVGRTDRWPLDRHTSDAHPPIVRYVRISQHPTGYLVFG